MRYECDIPGLEDNFIEMADTWSRREVRDFLTLNGEEYLALLQSKLLACHLSCPDAAPITEPVAFTAEVMDMLDIRIVQWASSVPIAHVQALGALGEASRRRLFGITEMKADSASDATSL